MTQINKLKVTTCNLCNFVEPPFAYYEMENIYTAKQWQQKTLWLKQTLSELNSDVVAFQEVFSVEALRALVKSLGYGYFTYNTEPRLESGYIYSHPALAFASRYPIVRHSNLTSLAPFEGEFSRPALHISLNIKGLGELDMYNVHLKSKRPTLPDENLDNKSTVNAWLVETQGQTLSSLMRIQEAGALHQAIVQNKRCYQRPFLLLGDFNNSIGSNEFEPFRSQYRHRRKDTRADIKAYHFHDSWDLVPKGKPVRPVDEIKPPITHYYGEYGSRLDHILLSSEFCPNYERSMFEVTDYQLTNKHIIDPIFGIDDLSTDHALVSVSFETRA